MNTVDNQSNTSNVTTQRVKRGRPRRLEAVVCGGDELISALACGVGGLSVDVGGDKVSVEEAVVRKMLDVKCVWMSVC